MDLSRIHEMRIAGNRVPDEVLTEENIRALLEAVKADCEDRTMTQDSYYHNGAFKIPAYEGDVEEFYYDVGLYVDISAWTGSRKELTGMWFRIFADSENCLNWLRENDLLTYEIVDVNTRP